MPTNPSLNPDLDNLGDFGDFDTAMAEGERRVRSATEQASRALLGNTAKRTALTFTRELGDSAPNIASAYYELANTYRDVRDLGGEFVEGVKQPIHSIRKSAAKLLPYAGKFLPPKLKARLDALAAKIDVADDESPESAERRRTADAESEVSAIFKSQIANAKAFQDTTKSEGALGRAVSMAVGNRNAKILGQIAGGVGAIVRFQQTTYMAYLKKSLEIQYKHLFVGQDSLTTLLSATKILDTKLEAIRLNTSLSEQQKTELSQRLQHNARRSVSERIFSYREDFMKNVRSNVLRTVIDLLGTVAMAGESGTMAVDLSKDMEEAMGGPQEDYKTRAARTGGQIAGGILGDRLGRFSGHRFVRKFRPLIEDLDSRIAGGKTKLLSKLEETRQTWSSAGGLRSIIASLMPDMSPHDVITNDFFDTAEKPAAFDNATRLSIVEVIPGWLSMIHHEIARQRDPMAQQLRYNKITRGFTTKEDYRKDVFDRMLGTPDVRGQFVTRSTGIMRGAYLEKQRGEPAEFDKVANNIRRIMQNLANAFLTFDPDRFQEWLSGVDPNNALSAYNTAYARKAFVGIPEVEVVDTVRTMLSAVSLPNGEWDEYAIRQLHVPHLRAMEDDKFRMLLPRVVNTLGDRDLFSDLVDKSGIVNQNAMANMMLSGSADARTKIYTAETEAYASRHSEYTQNMKEFQPYLDKLGNYANKVTSRFKPRERLMRIVNAVDKHADTITDPKVREEVKQNMAHCRLWLNAMGDTEEGRRDVKRDLELTGKLFLNMSMDQMEKLALNVGAYYASKGYTATVDAAKKAAAAATQAYTAATSGKTATSMKTAWTNRTGFFNGAKAVLSVLKDRATSSPKYQAVYNALHAAVNKVRHKIKPDVETADAEAKLAAATDAINNSGDTSLTTKLKEAMKNAGGAVKRGAETLLHSERDASYQQAVLQKFDAMLGYAEAIAQNTKPGTAAQPNTLNVQTQIGTKKTVSLKPLQTLVKSLKEYRKEQETRDDRNAAQMDSLINVVSHMSAMPRSLLYMIYDRSKRLFHRGGKLAWDASRTAIDLFGRVYGGALRGAGWAIGGTAKGAGWAIKGIATALFGGTPGKEEEDRYVDLYVRDEIDPKHPVVTARQQRKGVFFVSTGARVESSYALANSDDSVADAKGNLLVTSLERGKGLVDVFNKNVKRPKKHKATSGSGLGGAAVKGGLSGLGKFFGGFYGGLFSFAKVALFGRAASPVKELDPYVDIYVPDDKGNIKIGHPTLSGKQQERGVYRSNGTKIERSEDITEPVYKVKGGKLDLTNALITAEDIKRGLVDAYGKPISRRKAAQQPQGKTAGVGGLIGAAASVLRHVIGPLTGQSINVTGGILKLYLQALGGGLKGIGYGIKGIVRGSSWLFNRLMGRDPNRTDDPMFIAITKLYDLIDKRTKDLDVYIKRAMPAERREGSMDDQESDQARRDALRKRMKLPAGTVIGPDGKPINITPSGTGAAGANGKDGQDQNTTFVDDFVEAELVSRASEKLWGAAKGASRFGKYGKFTKRGLSRAALKLGGRTGLKAALGTAKVVGAGVGLKALTLPAEVAAGAAWTSFNSKARDKYIDESFGGYDDYGARAKHAMWNNMGIDRDNIKLSDVLLSPLVMPFRTGKAVGSIYGTERDIAMESAKMLKNRMDVGKMQDRLRNVQITDLKKWGVSLDKQASFMGIEDPIERERVYKLYKAQYRGSAKGASFNTSTGTSADGKTTVVSDVNRPSASTSSTQTDVAVKDAVTDLNSSVKMSQAAMLELQERNLKMITRLEAVMSKVADNTGVLSSVNDGIQKVVEKPVPPPLVVQPTVSSNTNPIETTRPILDICKPAW